MVQLQSTTVTPVVGRVVGPLPPEIRGERATLFHDVRPDWIDPERHAAFVIARVLDYGTSRSVEALVRYYGRERIRTFFCIDP